ncbi:unnamed protein product [Candidula unifasciata]|uniref:Uncharacterized protein n=1 Tax=Candidula unifasciata TaxID=100452 RepID=A0A8S3YJC1_9EUPU|nr:unnamed protein product [Candidula unifasciata]
MAAGHILPGYGDPVTRLRRVLSVGCYPLNSTALRECEKAACLSQQEFSQIRETARQLWSKQYPRMTTYETYFSNGEIREVTQTRPTSSDRHNNPHPTQLFITNKLHFIEGFHKPDTTLGTSAYRVDAGVSSAEKRHRQSLHENYVARPDSALTYLYKDPYGFKKVLPPIEAQAAEAWVKLADDVDHNRVMEVLKEQTDVLKPNNNTARPKSAYPSLHRWMKMCGAEENEAISKVMQQPSARNCQSPSKELQPVRSASKKEACTKNPCIHTKLRRGEYSIHPNWPTSLLHHRVP